MRSIQAVPIVSTFIKATFFALLLPLIAQAQTHICVRVKLGEGDGYCVYYGVYGCPEDNTDGIWEDPDCGLTVVGDCSTTPCVLLPTFGNGKDNKDSLARILQSRGVNPTLGANPRPNKPDHDNMTIPLKNLHADVARVWAEDKIAKITVRTSSGAKTFHARVALLSFKGRKITGIPASTPLIFGVGQEVKNPPGGTAVLPLRGTVSGKHSCTVTDGTMVFEVLTQTALN